QRTFCLEKFLIVEIAHFLFECGAKRFPPWRDARNGAVPVRYAEKIHASSKSIGSERKGGKGHVATVRSPDNACTILVHKASGSEHLLALDHVIQIGIPVFTVVQVIERLTVSARAPVVDGVDSITMIDQVLR